MTGVGFAELRNYIYCLISLLNPRDRPFCTGFTFNRTCQGPVNTPVYNTEIGAFNQENATQSLVLANRSPLSILLVMHLHLNLVVLLGNLAMFLTTAFREPTCAVPANDIKSEKTLIMPFPV